MRGTKFELDEQKASKLSGMSVNEVWDFINQKAKEADLIVIKNGEYHAKGFFKNAFLPCCLGLALFYEKYL